MALEDAQILTYILSLITPSETELEELDGCRILPLADGNLGTLRISTSGNSYILASKSDVELFKFAARQLILYGPWKEGRLQLRKLLVESGRFNVHKMALIHIGALVDAKEFLPDKPTKATDSWLQRFWRFWRKREASESLTGNGVYLQIRRHPILEATCKGIKRHMSLEELDALPSVIEPASNDYTALCDAFIGLYRVNPELMPLNQSEAENSLSCWKSFRRFVVAISKLAREQGQDLVSYVQNTLDNAYRKTLRDLIIFHFSGSNLADINGIALELSSLPIWDAFESQGLAISARQAFTGPDSRLCGPWLMHEKQLILSDRVPESVLMALDVERIRSDILLMHHILPNLPQNITDHKNSYLSMITAVSHLLAAEFSITKKKIKGQRKRFLENLSLRPLAADMDGELRPACKLFDDTDVLFVSALRSDPGTVFLLHEVRRFRTLWLALGLRHRANGLLKAEDFVFCLQALRSRFEAADSPLTDTELLSDARTVLLPLTTSADAFDYLPHDDWLGILQHATFPALTSLEHQPAYRRQTMILLAIAHPLMPLPDIISYQYMPICWSQTSFPAMQPSPDIFRRIDTTGKPPVPMVWRHLESLAEFAKDLTEQAIPDFLADLNETYSYLQDHLGKSGLEFALQKSCIWLNMELELATVESIKSSWHSIDNILLSISYDCPPFAAARSSLMPYERLLKALGCRSITYVTRSTAPPSHVDRSLAEKANRLRQEDKMLDVTFAVGNSKVRAHKVILATASEYCETQFNGSWKTDQDIDIEDISFATLSTMINFIYQDPFDWTAMQVNDMDSIEAIADKLDNLLEILVGANRWLMPVLLNEAQNQILHAERAFIQVNNVLEVHKCALDANAHEVARACMEFCRQNRETVELAYSDREELLPTLSKIC